MFDPALVLVFSNTDNWSVYIELIIQRFNSALALGCRPSGIVCSSLVHDSEGGEVRFASAELENKVD